MFEKLVEMMIRMGWDEIDGRIVWVNDPNDRPTFDSWFDAIVSCIEIASEM